MDNMGYRVSAEYPDIYAKYNDNTKYWNNVIAAYLIVGIYLALLKF